MELTTLTTRARAPEELPIICSPIVTLLPVNTSDWEAIFTVNDGRVGSVVSLDSKTARTLCISG